MEEGIYEYTLLDAIYQEAKINVYGVVVSAKIKKLKEFFVLEMLLCDDKTDFDSTDPTVTCCIYSGSLKKLPSNVVKGDIIRLHRIECQDRLRPLKLELKGVVDKSGFAWALWTQKSRINHPLHVSKNITIEDHDKQRVRELRNWYLENFSDNPNEGHDVILGRRRTHTLEDSIPKQYRNYMARVVGVLKSRQQENQTLEPIVVRIIDGSQISMVETIDKSEVRTPMSMSKIDVKSEDWEILEMHMQIHEMLDEFCYDVFVYDEFREKAAKLKPGEIVIFYNCHLVVPKGSKSVNLPALAMHTGGKEYGRDILVVNTNDINGKQLTRSTDRLLSDAREKMGVESEIQEPSLDLGSDDESDVIIMTHRSDVTEDVENDSQNSTQDVQFSPNSAFPVENRVLRSSQKNDASADVDFHKQKKKSRSKSRSPRKQITLPTFDSPASRTRAHTAEDGQYFDPERPSTSRDGISHASPVDFVVGTDLGNVVKPCYIPLIKCDIAHTDLNQTLTHQMEVVDITETDDGSEMHLALSESPTISEIGADFNLDEGTTDDLPMIELNDLVKILPMLEYGQKIKLRDCKMSSFTSEDFKRILFWKCKVCQKRTAFQHFPVTAAAAKKLLCSTEKCKKVSKGKSTQEPYLQIFAFVAHSNGDDEFLLVFSDDMAECALQLTTFEVHRMLCENEEKKLEERLMELKNNKWSITCEIEKNLGMKALKVMEFEWD